MKKSFLQVLMTLLLVPMTVWAQGERQDFTDRITNPSFETGDLTGWTHGDIGGDNAVRPNSDATYTTSGCDGAYLYNSWYSSNGYIFVAPNQFVEQTVKSLPAGEYRLVALVTSDNHHTPVELYANDVAVGCTPQVKTQFNELELPFFVTPSTLSVKLGTRSAGWYKCDHFRLYYLGETDDYKAAIGETDGTQGLKPSLVEYFTGYVTDGWEFTKLPGHDHGNFPLSTNNMDNSIFEASEMNYWTGPANRLGDATILYTYTGLPAGWYEFESLVRVYDENGDFDGTAQGLNMICGSVSQPITEGSDIADGSLIGKGFTGKYSVMAEVGSDGNLQVGFGTTGASFNWLTWTQTRVQYYGTKKPVSTTALKRIETLASLADQVVDASAFTPVYQQALMDLKTAETEAEMEAIVNTVRNAVLQLVKTGESKTGLFDLTPLIVNADMEEGEVGWTVTNSDLKVSSMGIGMVSNTRNNVRFSQVLADMPAGHYLLQAQGFYRGQTMAEYMRNYEKGIEDKKATLFVNDAGKALQSLMSGRRYIPQQSSGIQSAIDGRGVPTSIASVPACFALGDYWNTLETTMDADGDMTLGINIQPTSFSENMAAFSHFRLLYGNTVPEITFSDSDTEFSLTEPVRAHVILNKSFAAGVLTPLCLPFDIDEQHFAELYCVGSAVDKSAQIYRVSRVKAGVPCVVKTAETVDAIDFGIVTLSPVKPDVHVLPWGGGWLETFYIKENRRESNYCWKFKPMSQTTLTAATSMGYQLLEPMHMDFMVTLENLSARKFLSENTYTFDNDSKIKNYYNVAPPMRRDIPNPVMVPVGIDDASNIYVEWSEDKTFATSESRNVFPGANAFIPNLYPQRTYFFRVVADGTTVSQGRFHTEGRLRMIYAPSANNIRDLGGWLTADRSKRTTYGHIFRGSELNGAHVATAADLQVLRNLGITSEIDLRWNASWDNDGVGISAFGFNSNHYYFVAGNDWLAEDLTKEESIEHWRNEWNLVIKTLREGKALYYHCVWGADRTGLFSMLLEGILGLSYDAIFKDYELTSYSLAGLREKSGWNDRIEVIDGLEGANQAKKFENYFLNTLKIPQEEIDYFRSVMLEDVTVQPVTIDEDEDYGCHKEGYTDVTLHVTLQPGQRNALVLPFALNSSLLRTHFGQGTLVELISGFDGNELTTRKIYATTPNVPFLITPVQVNEDNTYLMEKVTLVRGAAVTSPFPGGRFCGNYIADLDVQQAGTDDVHSSYVLNDVCFYKADVSTPTLQSLHAYVVLDLEDAKADGVVYFEGETPTGINTMTKDPVRGLIYDLTGRRVLPNERLKGLYIINGKKVLLK